MTALLIQFLPPILSHVHQAGTNELEVSRRP
jgi:hypothetical protein